MIDKLSRVRIFFICILMIPIISFCQANDSTKAIPSYFSISNKTPEVELFIADNKIIEVKGNRDRKLADYHKKYFINALENRGISTKSCNYKIEVFKNIVRNDKVNDSITLFEYRVITESPETHCSLTKFINELKVKDYERMKVGPYKAPVSSYGYYKNGQLIFISHIDSKEFNKDFKSEPLVAFFKSQG